MEEEFLLMIQEVKALRRDVREMRQYIVIIKQNQELGNMEGLADLIDAPALKQVLHIEDRSFYDLRQSKVFNTYTFKEGEGGKPGKLYFFKSEVLEGIKRGKL
ncbi:hypothetical protein SAMN05216436_103167 [bacterium A37T11]|nr:hypothetical protein SAMN05216436_103167 [bacterium A37T11]